MLKIGRRLPSILYSHQKPNHLTASGGIQGWRQNSSIWGSAMRFRSLVILLFSIAAGFVLSGSAAGQATPPSQSVVSAPPSATASPDAAPSIELVQPAA